MKGRLRRKLYLKFSGDKKRIPCRNPRCRNKFPIEVGRANNCIRTAICPECKTENNFRVDENGKVRMII